MGGFNRGVERVVRTALRRGSSIGGSYAATVEGGVLELRHYGTMILRANANNGSIYATGGWSNSDRDAIETALKVLGSPSYVTRSERVAKSSGLKSLRGSTFYSNPSMWARPRVLKVNSNW